MKKEELSKRLHAIAAAARAVGFEPTDRDEYAWSTSDHRIVFSGTLGGQAAWYAIRLYICPWNSFPVRYEVETGYDAADGYLSDVVDDADALAAMVAALLEGLK